MRMRQQRQMGLRTGFPAIAELPSYDCGCSEPCLRDVPSELMQRLFKDFQKCSTSFHQRRRENQFLLNHLMCPLLNRTVCYCNRSLSALFTVSEGRIANIRGILDYVGKTPSLDPTLILEEAARGYRYTKGHPISRLGVAVREKIETYLDMALRPDPGASDGVNVCRVYSPEINTQEKLRKLLAEELKNDEVLVNPISSTTLQRMIQEYLDARNCKISFTQSDHNACPNCKAMQYAVLQFSLERKKIGRELASLIATERPYPRPIAERVDSLQISHGAKRKQEDTCFMEMRDHVLRDARIRGFLKKLTDHFRDKEIKHMKSERKEGVVSQKYWRERNGYAILTHQDDMTKVDLPSFIVNASSDITRWRYDINAHVNAVTGDAIVFSNEQGSGAKDASAIFEHILLDHLLRCRGEAIKVIVSDNAAVGNNWLTTIALPQYMVDQGLADICIVAYLENNHGKWLSDMLFGQLQLRKRRSTIPGVDALLSEFEAINKKNGSIQGFVLNPLSSVKFSAVLSSLGYATKPPSDFGFVKRNIHFATACAENAVDRLEAPLRRLLGDMLPPSPGMVRTCSDPPSNRAQNKIPFGRRYFDIPAASNTPASFIHEDEPPLVVEMDQPFAEKGSCVASSRNMGNVGYNGFEFRKLKAYPELQNPADPLVKQTWPPGLIRLQDAEASDGLEPIGASVFVKCAPENWIARRPVRHFRDHSGYFVARYPPRNMLNAKYQKGPRVEFAHEDLRWRSVATYEEPPFPLNFAGDICALPALREFSEQNKRIDKSLTVLDLMKCVFKRIRGPQELLDPWGHRPVTRASPAAMDTFSKEMMLFSDREKGHPRSTKSVKQMFKVDRDVKEKVSRIMDETGNRGSRAATAISNRLFNQTAQIPGGLARFESAVAKDMERYAKEVRHFQDVVQYEFDRENGLLPIQTAEPEEGDDTDLEL